jgi:chromosome segregation ATPase
MNSLRIEADEASSKVEDLQKQVKTLEQENLQKEHEITSLTHKNSGLEAEVDKLETQLKDAKAMAEESGMHLRETNDKYVYGISKPALLASLWLRECHSGDRVS